MQTITIDLTVPIKLTVKPTLIQAWEWLEKAITFEKQGRASSVHLALRRACQLELAALGFLPFIAEVSPHN